MTEPKQCVSIPCPEFTELQLDAQPIGWFGLTFTEVTPREPFLTLTLPEQVEKLWDDLCEQAAVMRRIHKYSDDTAVSICLPDNPALAEVFAALKARAVHGTPLRIELAGEES